jgi:endonuclease YncB( thermonuclease family)
MKLQHRSSVWRSVWGFSLVVFAISVGATEVFVARVLSVSDGDTLWVVPAGGEGPRKLRLDGIDAPEICQAGGVASRDTLRQLVDRQSVRVFVRAHDDYGRGLAHIEVNGRDVGAAMVLVGQAWSYRWRRSLGPYATEESMARLTKAGLFAEATPELPRDFRKRHGSCYPDR